jgi:streptomycin 6-kinase
MRGIGDQCGHEGAAPEKAWSEGSEGNIAVRGLSCRPTAGVPRHHAVLVASAGPRFQIFALLTSGNDAEATKIAARHMALAIGEAR